ncbi:phospholipid-translocating P-type ATPase [Parathielavia hyrcaniae]|uniref:Phospholipid-transporting ATPase n=1 Tax=Parathielavia hyrcaniae TaxID=113614 RepID=A0AAN6SXC7_9PEZI|nr:phospholipid-translocating P-type ATPase [Parathielavia hyrcaniae]
MNRCEDGGNGGNTSMSEVDQHHQLPLDKTPTTIPLPAGTGRAQGRLSFSASAKAKQWSRRIVDHRILRRNSLPPSNDGRHIPLNPVRDGPLLDERRGSPYISNSIRTSRYTLYDFFPKQLFFQFTRLANFYFLCVGIPQTIPGISTTGNYTTILPLLFFVLLTIAKEGYDDWRRHRLDKVENAKLATVLRGATGSRSSSGWSACFKAAFAKSTRVSQVCETGRDNEFGLRWHTVEWRHLEVGDVIKLSRDEDVPADIVLLHADGEEGLAYIETMALDGETNLKSRQVSTALKGCDTFEGICTSGAEFVVEDPNPDLYRFDGRVTVDGETLPLTPNEVVYRGCTIRNTTTVFGMVINTGEETKIRRNANRHPSAKKPALERMANMIVIALVFYLIAVVAGCSGGYAIWQRTYERAAWYLADVPVPYSHIIMGYAIQFNNVIPLALYVSLEIIKICQMLMLNSDIEMYDAVSDTAARCNTNTILENLGQVGYLFSDKTGTLTENVMRFRKMSVAGTAWLHDMNLAQDGSSHVELPKGGGPTALTVDVEHGAPSPISTRHPRLLLSSATSTDRSPGRRSSSQWRSTGRPDHVQPDLTTADLLEYLRLRPNSAFSRRATQYLLAMALCHTCLPEVKDGNIDFQAASPDELALVRAAHDLGFLVIQRTKQAVTLRISLGDGHETRTYQILDVIEFSSKRKRMSIIVRCPDGRIWLITKGADSVILPRLRMTDLASQKAKELRESLEFEHQLLRMSEAREPRNSFGGRPSLTIRRSLALAQQGPVDANSSGRRPRLSRSKSFDIGRLVALSHIQPRNVLNARTASLDIFRSENSDRAPAEAAVPSKFTFLEDPTLSDDAAIFSRCFRQIDDFATEGLRTLLFAHKFLSEQEYSAWKELYHDAETSLVDRQDRIEAVGDMVEQSLDLIGASGIEDQLQPGVAETIDRLRRANIKIWMLTGDKRETAINIAHSARICRPGSDIFVLDAAKGDLQGQILTIMEDLQLQAETNTSHVPGHTVIVIDGHTLAALEHPDAAAARFSFYRLILTIDSVICCRASPAQKALLVHAVRDASTTTSQSHPGRHHHHNHHHPLLRLFTPSPRGPLTLAIGDGANDLAMLAAADVGVGISGREGLQAARVADYAVAQFRFLARLLLVHGRWNYARTARFVLATFWKEMLFYLPTALYQGSVGYTGTSLYESWSLTVFNTLFTSLCVIVPGVWEQELAAETLLAVPELYVFGQRDRGLNVRKYFAWMFGAAAEGVLVWFLCWALYGGVSPVRDGGLYAMGNLVFSVNVAWINLKLLLLDTHYKTDMIIGSFVITVGGWWVWQAFLAGVYAPGVWPYAVRDGFFSSFGPDPAWWMALVGVLGLLICIELAYKSVKRSLVVAGLWRLGRKWLKWSTWKRAFWSMSGTAGNVWIEEGPKGSLEEWDVELWQVMEQDPAIRDTLRQMSKLGCEGEGESAEVACDGFGSISRVYVVRRTGV